MSNYFHGGHFQQLHAQNHPMPQSHTHHGRSRRAPRLSASQNSHRQYRGSKSLKETPMVEPPSFSAFRTTFEQGRSFDDADDLEFCPYLMTSDERSIASGSSDRSSLSSGSPESSPTQHQIRPTQFTPGLSFSSATPTFVSPPSFTSNSNNLNTNNNAINNNMKIHQPNPLRTRNAIPIVDPTTGSRIASPPSSISPGMMQATTAARRWQ